MHRNWFSLIVILMVLASLTGGFVSSKVLATQAAQSRQVVDRNLKTLSMRSGPLEIFNLKVNGQEISSGRNFTLDEEWAKGLTFDVRNISDKVITHIGFSLVLRHSDGKSFALLFSHGRGILAPESKPTVRVMPGDVIHATCSDRFSGGFKLMSGPIGVVSQTDGTLAIGNVAFELDIESVMFEDDTMWKPRTGADFFHRNPLSPMSWIPISWKSVARPKQPILSLTITKDSTVSVAPQADATVIISLRNDFFARDWITQINFEVENSAAKPIRIVSIRHDEETSAGKSSGLVSDNAVPVGWTMKPGQYASFVYQYHPLKEETLKQITLSVDYVEFADGTSWGPDTFKSAERVAGFRAGVDAEREALLKVLTEGGPSAVLKAIEAGLPEREIPPEHTPEWEQNFGRGVKLLRTRLQLAQREEGSAAVERLLRNPIDILTTR